MQQKQRSSKASTLSSLEAFVFAPTILRQIASAKL
jgi:hypothetical protein